MNFSIPDGNRHGSQLLFTNSSMQKLRHCCQNLNLFPYLLYSLADVKSTTQKFTLNQLISKFTDGLFELYLNLRLSVHSRILKLQKRTPVKNVEKSQKFQKFERQKRRQNSLLLTFAVYSAPLVLAFQLIGIISLLILGKYTPGFIFLVSALLFLGYILMKVLSHDSDSKEYKKREKRKLH